MEPDLSRRKREMLQTLLEKTAGLPEDRVFFQPPSGISMAYPAVVYSRGSADNDFADNLPYRTMQAYTVTVIHADPDNEIRDRIAALRYCRFDRWYAADGLNHDVYTLYF